MATRHEIGQETDVHRLTDRVVGDESAARKVIQDRMATGTDDEFVAERGTTVSASRADLSKPEQTKQSRPIGKRFHAICKEIQCHSAS